MNKLISDIALDSTSSSDDIDVFARLAEHAYARMYKSSHPKDERDDALYHLNMALRIARVLKLNEREAELRARYEHIDAVFNAQFRG